MGGCYRGLPPPEGGVAIAVFRIFQEMLTNVARHAKATEADVRLVVADEVVVNLAKGAAPTLMVRAAVPVTFDVCDDWSKPQL